MKKKTKVLVRRRVPIHKRAAKSLALARRVQPQTVAPLTLGQEPMLALQFVGTLKLSAKQIADLRRPVKDDELDWKPAKTDGPPEIPYLSHNGYRDRLDAAFGLGGWGMVPTVAPKEKDGIVYCQYALVVGGTPRFFAWGEQAYHVNNKQMTYGDAIEGTKSNAIVRCGKELGIGRDLWSKRYIGDLKRRVPKDRRLSSGVDATTQQRKAPEPPEPTAMHDLRPITVDQQKAFWRSARGVQRTEAEVAVWLQARWGIDSSAKIQRCHFDYIVQCIEHPGQLPLVQSHAT
jgi:hypothetical protein